MSTRDRATAFDVDRCVRLVAEHGLTGDDAGSMHDETWQRLLHVVDLDDRTVRQPDHTRVGELPAALGIERRAVKHEFDPRTRWGCLDQHTVDKQAAHHGVTGQLAVSGELDRRADRVECRAVRGDIDGAGLFLLRVCLGALPLLFHESTEASLIDRKSLFRRHFQREIDRKAIRVVQCKRLIAANHRHSDRVRYSDRVLHSGLVLRHGAFEARGAGLQRRKE